jgi:hypothetical protein
MNFWGSLGFFLGQWTFASIAPGQQSSPFCNWQGWLLQINAAVFWYNAVLATNFVLRIRFGWTEDQVKRIEPYMHLFAWAYPVITSFVALGLNMYGKAGQWCWISIKYDWARWAFFFAELWVIMIYTTVCMILIVLTVKRSDDQTAYIRESAASTGSKPKRKKLGKKTREVAIQAMLYVATFLLTWVFGTANRIQNAVVAGTPGAVICNVFALTWLHSFFVPAQGFFNFLVYIYPRIRESDKKKEEKLKKKSLSDAKTTRCTLITERIADGVVRTFAVIFGAEKIGSDSQRDSTRHNANNTMPSNNPSGEVPSEPRSQNENEEDDSNSEQKDINKRKPPAMKSKMENLAKDPKDAGDVEHPSTAVPITALNGHDSAAGDKWTENAKAPNSVAMT